MDLIDDLRTNRTPERIELILKSFMPAGGDVINEFSHVLSWYLIEGLKGKRKAHKMPVA